MTSEVTLQELAREAASWFEIAKRETSTTSPDGRDDETSAYVRTKEGRPEWVQELVYDAHSGRADLLPDDWRYKCIRAALEALEECSDLDDCGHEFADGYADVYTGALVEWLGSHGSRPGYCDEARDELGWDEDRGIIGLMQLGQYAEALEVFESVRQSLENRRDELEAAVLFGAELDELTREA